MEEYSNGLPGNSAGFHVIGQRDVIGPDVELPFVDAEDAAQHRP